MQEWKHKHTKSQDEKDESQIKAFIKIQNICQTQKKKTHNAHKNTLNKMPNQKYKRKIENPIVGLLQILELLLHMKCGKT